MRLATRRRKQWSMKPISTSELAAAFLISHTKQTGMTCNITVEHVDSKRPSVYAAEQIAVQDYIQELEEKEESQTRFEVPDEPVEVPSCILRGEKGRYFAGFHPRRKHAMVIHDPLLAFQVPVTDAQDLIAILREQGHIMVTASAPVRGSL